MACSVCGTVSPSQARYCGACGALLAGGSAAGAEAPVRPPDDGVHPVLEPAGGLTAGDGVQHRSVAGPAWTYDPLPAAGARRDDQAPPPSSPPSAAQGPLVAAFIDLRRPETARAVALSVLVPLAVTVAVALVLTGAAGLTLGGGLAVLDPGLLLPMAVQLVAMSVLASLGATFGGDADFGSSGSLDLGVRAVPLALTVVLLTLVARRSRRAGHVSALREPRSVVAAALVTGTATALLLALLAQALAVRPDDELLAQVASDEVALSVELRAGFWTALVLGSVVLSAAVVVGRLQALHDREHAYRAWWAARLDALDERGWLLAWRLVRTQVLVGGALALVAAILFGAPRADSARELLSAVLLALLFLPNVALAGMAAATGVTSFSEAGTDTEERSSAGLLAGDVEGLGYLFLLVPLVATLVAAVRSRLRGPLSSSTSAWSTSVWRTGLVSLALWLAVAVVVRLSAEGEYALGFLVVLDTGGELSATAGLSLPSLVVLSFALGAAAATARALLVPRLAEMFPRTTLRVGGRRTNPEWASALRGLVGGASAPPPDLGHPLRDRRRRGRVVGAAVVALAGGGLVLIAVGAVLSRTVLGPGPAVVGALDAVNEGDVEVLAARVAEWPGEESALLSAEGLRETHRDERRLTDVEVMEVTDIGDDGAKQVDVRYDVGGQTRQGRLVVIRAEASRYGFLPQWEVSGLLGSLELAQTGTVSAYAVEGVSGQLTGFQTAPPGVYEVRPDAMMAGLDAPPTTVRVDPGGLTRVDPAVHVASDTVTQALAEVDALVEACADTDDPSPDGCPFSVYAYDPEDFDWQVTTPPSSTAQVEFDPSSERITVRGEVGLQATWTSQSWFSGPERVVEDVSDDYYYVVDMSGGQVQLVDPYAW